jgi:hypothetical protein
MSEQFLKLSRREFGLGLGAAPMLVPAAHAVEGDAPWAGPAVVKKVFVGVPKPTWPRPDLNFQQEMAGINGKLAELESAHKAQVHFTGGEWLKSAEDVEPWAKSLSSADAVLVLDLTSSTSTIMRALGKVDIAKLLFTRPITGWSFMNGASWIQSGEKADMVASSNYEDLAPLFPMLRAIHHLKHSKVLIVNSKGSGGGAAADFTARFGTTMAYPAYADLKAAFESIDVHKAEKEGAEFGRQALRVVEPTPNDIRNSWRLYLGVRELLAKEKANAITIDCLGGFQRGDLPAYPCVAWTMLNDLGMYGVCESDLSSTMTQLLLTSYSGKPGFVSDPTFDTSRNEVIHAHCVAATRMRGLGGAPSPFILRSHMEDNKGVSVQVRMPLGETITCARLEDSKTLLASTGLVTANVDSPRGCRTKIVTRVPDARKMVEGWTGGLHRVIFYGNHMEAAERMGRLMGFRVKKEC